MNNNFSNTTASKPEVAVLIPHFNNVDGLINTLNSITEDEPVDIIIVDDGSQIKPNIEILPNKQTFGKIQIIPLPVNQGIAFALNAGLAYIAKNNYKYVGIIDCDDLSVINRFTIQKKYLENHQDVGLLGTQCEFIDTEGKFLYNSHNPLKNYRSHNYIFNPFIHPSIMYRAGVIKDCGLYPTHWRYNIDNAYIFEIFKKYKAENLDLVLVKCQLNDKSYSPKNYKKQRLDKISIIFHYFEFKYAFFAVLGIIKNLIAIILGYKIMYYFATLLKH